MLIIYSFYCFFIYASGTCPLQKSSEIQASREEVINHPGTATAPGSATSMQGAPFQTFLCDMCMCSISRQQTGYTGFTNTILSFLTVLPLCSKLSSHWGRGGKATLSPGPSPSVPSKKLLGLVFLWPPLPLRVTSCCLPVSCPWIPTLNPES